MYILYITCASLDSLLTEFTLIFSELVDTDDNDEQVSEKEAPKFLPVKGPYTSAGDASADRFQGSLDDGGEADRSILWSLLAGLGALQMESRVSTASLSTDSSTTEPGLSMNARLHRAYNKTHNLVFSNNTIYAQDTCSHLVELNQYSNSLY